MSSSALSAAPAAAASAASAVAAIPRYFRRIVRLFGSCASLFAIGRLFRAGALTTFRCGNFSVTICSATFCLAGRFFFDCFFFAMVLPSSPELYHSPPEPEARKLPENLALDGGGNRVPQIGVRDGGGVLLLGVQQR